jgi:hypothetical protein
LGEDRQPTVATGKRRPAAPAHSSCRRAFTCCATTAFSRDCAKVVPDEASNETTDDETSGDAQLLLFERTFSLQPPPTPSSMGLGCGGAFLPSIKCSHCQNAMRVKSIATEASGLGRLGRVRRRSVGGRRGGIGLSNALSAAVLLGSRNRTTSGRIGAGARLGARRRLVHVGRCLLLRLRVQVRNSFVGRRLLLLIFQFVFRHVFIGLRQRQRFRFRS